MFPDNIKTRNLDNIKVYTCNKSILDAAVYYN